MSRWDDAEAEFYGSALPSFVAKVDRRCHPCRVGAAKVFCQCDDTEFDDVEEVDEEDDPDD